MPRLIILGTSNAIPTREHDNTHMVLLTSERTILVDCASNPVVRLKQAGLDPNCITDLILTHFHPDHIGGVPLYLMSMWLLGRKDPLRVIGLADTIERARAMMELYSWQMWPNFYPVEFVPVAQRELAPVLECAEVRILASPMQHFIPNIGLRFELKHTGRIVSYSCDTEPCSSLLRLTENADILIHEATGPIEGHSSAAQAGQAAAAAQAGALYLIHYPMYVDHAQMLLDAGREFDGPVHITYDFMEIPLD